MCRRKWIWHATFIFIISKPLCEFIYQTAAEKNITCVRAREGKIYWKNGSRLRIWYIFSLFWFCFCVRVYNLLLLLSAFVLLSPSNAYASWIYTNRICWFFPQMFDECSICIGLMKRARAESLCCHRRRWMRTILSSSSCQKNELHILIFSLGHANIIWIFRTN